MQDYIICRVLGGSHIVYVRSLPRPSSSAHTLAPVIGYIGPITTIILT